MRLSLNDYKSILKYYNIDITGMKTSAIKNKAEDILAEKLCRCIKSVDKYKNKVSEAKAIAICKNSVLTKKNLKIAKFKCKTSAKLLPSKKNSTLVKIKSKMQLTQKKQKKSLQL
uniref:Uncharacterized protein n=1 Tax=viral metagenome TaxID=1070528 RepID=A0A6C0IHG1_9ZZZZ